MCCVSFLLIVVLKNKKREFLKQVLVDSAYLGLAMGHMHRPTPVDTVAYQIAVMA